MEQEKPKLPDYLRALLSEQGWLKLLLNKNKKYQPLIMLLLEQNDIEDFAYHGAGRRISAQLKIDSGMVKTWLEKIYEDLWELNLQEPSLFSPERGREYQLSLVSDDGQLDEQFTLFTEASFAVGDGFDWSFAKPKLGRAYFYISKVSHVYERGELKTFLELRPGFYNQYREFLLSQLSFLNHLTPGEMVLSRYELNEILKERRRRL